MSATDSHGQRQLHAKIEKKKKHTEAITSAPTNARL
jgi:hypothetical protein